MKLTIPQALLSIVAFLLFVPTSGAREGSQSPYEGDRFSVTVEMVSDGIYVMTRKPSWRFPVQANTTLIVNESDAIIIDGGFGAYAENVIGEVRRLTNKPVSILINTHWHGDHNVGHYVFKREWPDARIIAHDATRRLMADENVMDYIASTAAMDVEELLGPRRERLAEMRSDDTDPELIAYLEDVIKGLPVVRADYARWQMALADETFSKRLVLHRGNRAVEILHFGTANTPGDAIVWLPRERIVVTGDTVVRPTPYGFGSRPALARRQRRLAKRQVQMRPMPRSTGQASSPSSPAVTHCSRGCSKSGSNDPSATAQSPNCPASKTQGAIKRYG